MWDSKNAGQNKEDSSRLVKNFWRAKSFKKHSLVHRLRNRQLGFKISNETFSQNLPLNGSINHITTPGFNSYPRNR